MEIRSIYMDHAATTPVRAEVVEAMLPYLKGEYGNPSSLHGAGRRARDAVERAREKVAASIGAAPQEIVFTSGGTESDNLGVIGAMQAMEKKGRNHLITSAIEHHAVSHSASLLRQRGFDVTIVKVGEGGQIDPRRVEESLRSETGVVSVMMANNETGTIQPIAQVAKFLEGRETLFHTDAVQAVGKVPVDVSALGVDMLSISSHKLHGPKGVGALYMKKGSLLAPLLVGGPHEFGRRAGTENVPGIVGFALALDLATRELDTMSRKVAGLRDRLQERISERIEGVALTGDPEERLPSILNIRFRGVPAEALVVRLDEEGVAISSGSACTAETLEPSPILLALGLDRQEAGTAVRFSVGRDNTEAEVDRVTDLLVHIVSELRSARSARS
ncbi:MAG: cysteine desulfurase family protein [Planctomycetota bacterium]|nr:cysteine desulfurase family protein [Planctomycetota bacterium]